MNQRHCTNIGHSQYNSLEKPKNLKTTGVMSNIHRMGQPRKIPTADDRNIGSAVKKNLKPTVTTEQGCRCDDPGFKETLKSPSVVRKEKYRDDSHILQQNNIEWRVQDQGGSVTAWLV